MCLKQVDYICIPIVVCLLLQSTDGIVVGPLLFPSSSVLQVTAAVSVPVILPNYKLFFDWGLQMNYALPNKPSSFYNSPIWADELARRQKRKLLNETIKYTDASGSVDIHPRDFTAGELYENVETMLSSKGFDETCLLRSVCELARHPFNDQHENMLTALITFTLTPSLHQAFGPKEVLYRSIYEEAEQRGFFGDNCTQLYPDCKIDLVSAISKLMS